MSHPIPAFAKLVCRVLCAVALIAVFSVPVMEVAEAANVLTPQIIPSPAQLPCLKGTERWNGKCVPVCPPGQVHLPPNGACAAVIRQPLLCLAPNEVWDGHCVPRCRPGQVHVPPVGQCAPAVVCALQGKEMWNNQCVQKCPPPLVHKAPDGHCGPPLQ